MSKIEKFIALIERCGDISDLFTVFVKEDFVETWKKLITRYGIERLPISSRCTGTTPHHYHFIIRATKTQRDSMKRYAYRHKLTRPGKKNYECRPIKSRVHLINACIYIHKIIHAKIVKGDNKWYKHFELEDKSLMVLWQEPAEELRGKLIEHFKLEQEEKEIKRKYVLSIIMSKNKKD